MPGEPNSSPFLLTFGSPGQLVNVTAGLPPVLLRELGNELEEAPLAGPSAPSKAGRLSATREQRLPAERHRGAARRGALRGHAADSGP